MAVQSFTIELTPNNQVYTTGDTINGEVKLVLDSQIKLTSLLVCFYGKGKIEYVRGNAVYVGKEEYYRDAIYLLDEVQVRNLGCVLQPGSYSFPFSFHIPVDANLPGSHSGKRGYIRYTVEAHMKKPNQIIDDTTTITVQFVDFAVIEEKLLTTQRQHLITSVGPSCCTSGSLSITAKIDRGGYYIGDEVTSSLYIDNKSGRDVIDAEMYLQQLTTYCFRTKHPEEQVKEKKLSFTRTNGVSRGQDVNIECLNLTIPDVKPTSLCGIIKTAYSIEIVVHIAGKFSKHPHFSFPVVIGNVHSTQIDRLLNKRYDM